MIDPRKISIHDFAYSLPEEKIAKYPLAERDASKLLIYQNGLLRGSRYRDIADEIPEGSLVVFNDTRVIEARMVFQKPSGGMIEIFCLEPHEQYPDITTALSTTKQVLWQCFIGGASKWKRGQVLEKNLMMANEQVRISARFIGKRNDHFIIELSWEPATLTFAEILHVAGAIPLPPYIKRSVETSDLERYQTVFAQCEGSVAAPTAGLHFTPAVLDDLNKKHIASEFLTLHVGAGTFLPVKSPTLEDHVMHAEYMDVPKETIRHIHHHLDKNIVAAGTTSLRTLESLYWFGRQTMEDKEANLTMLDQWYAYATGEQDVPANESLQSLLNWMERRSMERLQARTQILIAPGYIPRIASALITNFHQPQSTLLLLVSALIGDDWKKVYAYALSHDYRFLSYGDGSILWINKS